MLPCVRPVDAAPLALMPSAEGIPDQKHALEDALAKLGCSVPGTTGCSHYTPFALPNLVWSAGVGATRPADRLPVPLPLVMIAQMMCAVLLASATAATLVVRRASNGTSHGRRVPCRCA